MPQPADKMRLPSARYAPNRTDQTGPTPLGRRMGVQSGVNAYFFYS